MTNPATIELDSNGALKWLRVGAQPSDAVRKILSARGVLLAFDLEKRGAKPEEVQAAVDTHLEGRQGKADIIANEKRKALEATAKAEAKALADAEAAAKAKEDAEAKAEAKAKARAEAAAEAEAVGGEGLAPGAGDDAPKTEDTPAE